jgi:uncharacterized caspase-like protein
MRQEFLLRHGSPNDAADIAKALREIGFSVTLGTDAASICDNLA